MAERHESENRVNYKYWFDMFGRSADDPAVRSALAKAGVTKAIEIARDELGVSADIPGTGLTIGFRDESILRPNLGIEGRPILYSILMLLKHPKKPTYAGDLPERIGRDSSRDQLRSIFGSPTESDEDMGWDAWATSGVRTTVTYASDFGSVSRVAVRLEDGV